LSTSASGCGGIVTDELSAHFVGPTAARNRFFCRVVADRNVVDPSLNNSAIATLDEVSIARSKSFNAVSATNQSNNHDN
jgi:hypothetical protein